MLEIAVEDDRAILGASAGSLTGVGGGGSDNGLQSSAFATETSMDSDPVV